MYQGNEEERCESMEVGPRHVTLSEKLERKGERLRAELIEVEAAIKALKDNPGVEQTIDAISKALGRI